MYLIKKIFYEPKCIFKDILGFFKTSYKKPVSFFFNYLFFYQNLRIEIDKYLTEKYQKIFLKLEKSENQRKKLKHVQKFGVLKIENFFKFDNKEKIFQLLSEKDKDHNSEKRILLFNKNEQNYKEIEKYLNLIPTEKLINKILYFLSFIRGENYNKNQVRFSFVVTDGANITDNFHTDMFSHSPKGYLYLKEVDKDSRPFNYLLKSHKDYPTRKKLENLTGKKLYKGDSKFNSSSSRLKESNEYENYFKDYEIFEGLANEGDIIFVDTSGFHAKGEGFKPRYALWIEPKRENLLKKLTSIFSIKEYLSSLELDK